MGDAVNRERGEGWRKDGNDKNSGNGGGFLRKAGGGEDLLFEFYHGVGLDLRGKIDWPIRLINGSDLNFKYLIHLTRLIFRSD